jgi:hypothetical protein
MPPMQRAHRGHKNPAFATLARARTRR